MSGRNFIILNRIRVNTIVFVSNVVSHFDSGPKEVVVIGMHRSGTSMTASLVQSLGVDMGEKNYLQLILILLGTLKILISSDSMNRY